MALDADGNYYLIGAHVGKTDEERNAKSYLFRFRLKEEGGRPHHRQVRRRSMVNHTFIRPRPRPVRARQRLNRRRKIEGLAVRDTKNAEGTKHRELIIGAPQPR